MQIPFSILYSSSSVVPIAIFSFKVNNENTIAMCQICSRLTVKTPNDVNTSFDVFIVNVKNITHCSGVFIVYFEQVGAS